MKALLITGLMAKEAVEYYAHQSRIETNVLALKVPVAAFLTPQAIIRALTEMTVDNFDVVLVPGLMRGDVSPVTAAVGVPTFKGPQYAADLPTVLDSLGRVELSTVIPADEIIGEKLKEKALQEIAQVEANCAELLKRPGNFLLHELPVGRDFPMRVLAEIVDATLLTDDEIACLARRYVAEGADLVDIGMVAGESRPADAKRAVTAAKRAVKVPVSIDSLDPAEIKGAIEAGADLVLSVDEGNISSVAPMPSNVVVVAIPTNQKEAIYPKGAEERVSMLEQVVAKAKRLGVKRVLGDVILDPMDIVGSFCAYRMFAQRNPDVPLFVGVSNVTELMDADSIGVNALVARLSSEVGASMLLATQKSQKAQGSVKEEVTAAKMMFLARRRGSVPKDLGIDLLVVKDKRNRELPYNRELQKVAKVMLAAEVTRAVEEDKNGVFRIFLDREEQTIVAAHYASGEPATPNSVIKDKTAEAIYVRIVDLGLVSRLDHASYLGNELAKAEIALRIGKEYIQDKPLFKG